LKFYCGGCCGENYCVGTKAAAVCGLNVEACGLKVPAVVFIWPDGGADYGMKEGA